MEFCATLLPFAVALIYGVTVFLILGLRDSADDIKRHFVNLNWEAKEIRKALNAGAEDFERIADKVCPPPPPEPTKEELMAHDLQALEARVIQHLAEYEKRQNAKHDARPSGATIGAALPSADLEEVKLQLGSVAAATQANGEALKWLIEFVRRANPGAAA